MALCGPGDVRDKDKDKEKKEDKDKDKQQDKDKDKHLSDRHETKTKTLPRQYKAWIPSVWKILRRLFCFEGTLFKEGAWSPTFPHTNHPKRPEARNGKFVFSVGSGNPATSVYPQRGAFSPQDKTVPGLCPRVVAEEIEGNQ